MKPLGFSARAALAGAKRPSLKYFLPLEIYQNFGCFLVWVHCKTAFFIFKFPCIYR
jgi:hypothetical protein